MPELEKEEEQQAAPTDPASQPLQRVPPVQYEDEDPDQIFQRAVAEIDTQPLGQKKARYSVASFLQDALCLAMVCLGIAGIIWQCIAYPHMLVVLFTKAQPTSITTPLDVPTRTLAPITLTRSATRATTGTGYQQARAATGHVTFYNGLSTGQTIPAGTVLTGRDGIQVVTIQEALIPAADTTTTPPTDGYATVAAQAVQPGGRGNIAAYDVSVVFSPSLTVKNLAAFTRGQDARTFRAVAQRDVQALTTTVNDELAQAFPTAFPVQPSEAGQPTNCTTKARSSHLTGDEAQIVTLTMARTCAAVAYQQSQLTRAATTAFSRTRPAAAYHLVGSIRTIVRGISPLTVTLNGKWAYTFSQDYQDFLAEHIQGESPAQARSYLLRTGVISYASIPAKLPAAMYINFVVLLVTP